MRRLPLLVDPHGREHRDLRISLTDHCNLRCTYCMPADGLQWFPTDEVLTDAEVLRVLVPGGRFCVLEFGSGKDRILFGLYNLYLAYVLPCIGRLVSRDKGAYQYLADTVAAYPAASVLAGEMRQAGFVNVRFRFFTAGIVCLHSGEKPL